MQYIKYDDNGKIMSLSYFKLDGYEEAKENVIISADGTLKYESEIDQDYESEFLRKRQKDLERINELSLAEAQRLPDVEDAAVDLAAYCSELESRILSLEAKLWQKSM